MDLSEAVVTEMSDLSPTVKKVVLKVTDPQFSFKAGQWVDFFIPGETVVGGFSMCSAPKLLKDRRLIELAVKRSPHPPADWVHTKCAVGFVVKLRVGGNFFYDPHNGDHSTNVLLVAGGVGINPLRSILLHHVDLLNEFKTKVYGYSPGKVALLYCSKTPDELLFKDDLFTLARNANFTCKLFASQLESPMQNGQAEICPGRITSDQVSTVPLLAEKEALTNTDSLTCYLCGPKEMVDSLVPSIEECGVAKHRIVYEAWSSPSKSDEDNLNVELTMSD